MAKNLSKFPFIFLFLVVVLAFCFPSIPKALAIHTSINTADTAWMLTATALVLIMTPGLAFFYGGMVNKKNVISTMLQSFICMVLITVIWINFLPFLDILNELAINIQFLTQNLKIDY